MRGAENEPQVCSVCGVEFEALPWDPDAELCDDCMEPYPWPET